MRVFFVQVSDFFCHGLNGYAGVWGQVGQVLGAFGVGDEFGGLFAVHGSQSEFDVLELLYEAFLFFFSLKAIRLAFCLVHCRKTGVAS